MNNCRKKILLAVMLLGIAAANSACSIMHAQSRIDPRTVAAYEAPNGKGEESSRCFTGGYAEDANIGVVNLDCARFPGDRAPAPTAYQLAAKAPAEPDRREYRNRLGAILMKHSDDVCTASIGRAANNEAGANTILNSLTTGLAAASTVVTGELAKSILSGAATTTSGVRDHINAEMFRNTLISAIGKAIEDQRRSMAVTIMANMSKSTADYPIDLLVMDVNRYHQECSYVRGLQLVTTAVDRSSLENLTNQVRSYDEKIRFLQAQVENGVAVEGKLKEAVEQRANVMTALPTNRAPDVSGTVVVREEGERAGASAGQPAQPAGEQAATKRGAAKK